EEEFPQLRSISVSSLLTRLNGFLRPKVIRAMMAQQTGLDMNEVINGGKILIIKLSQGLIGEENSFLLGTLLVSKLQHAAMARQSMSAEQRRPHFLYIDEFQHFITPSLKTILSGARKYGLGLVLVHQDLQQILREDPVLGNAIISNANTRVCFRVGDFDAQKLESGFAGFTRQDLQQLTTGQAIVRVGSSNNDANLTTSLPDAIPPDQAATVREYIQTATRKYYARPLAEVEATYTYPRRKPKTKLSEPSPISDPISVSPPLSKPEETDTPQLSSPDSFQQQAQEFTAKEIERRQQRLHEKIKHQLKEIGQERGFRVELEHPTPDSKGRIDVAMWRDDFKIAVEISDTTTPAHELQNIRKCFKAGYNLVVSVSADANHLQAIEGLVTTKLARKKQSQVYFLMPEELASWLDSFDAPPEEEQEQIIKGYKVKVNRAQVDPKEAREKRSSIARILGRVTKPFKKKLKD
ncbi:MAG: type IV secretory system conjugative DNA transfer family protein, partial [Cyanobacteria bacterium P01_A01_bin.137]